MSCAEVDCGQEAETTHQPEAQAACRLHTLCGSSDPGGSVTERVCVCVTTGAVNRHADRCGEGCGERRGEMCGER